MSRSSGGSKQGRPFRRARTVLGELRREARYTLGLLKALRPDPPCDPRVEVRTEGRIDGLSPFLAGTQSGLLYVREGRAWRLHGGSVYGISAAAGSPHWYVFQRIPGSFGRILRIDPANGTAASLVRFMSTGVHQIDWVNGRLAVMDTYNNRIALYDFRGRRRRSVYPCGPVENGRASANYKHFNSVFAAEGTVYVVAHNQSAATGMNSEIFVLDPGWRVLRVIPTESGSAHNVAEIEDELWHLDSRGGSLVKGGEPVYREPGLFTRGLAVNRDHVLIGGSELAYREERGNTDGQVVVMSKRFEPLGRLRFVGSGGVQEIRFLEGDLAMSGTQKGSPRSIQIKAQ